MRVLATTNRRVPEEPIEVPDNAVLRDWFPYSQAMAAAGLVISHGGHGTVVRALSLGAPLLACPAVGDMGENGARVAWSGAGLSLPRRLMSPRAIRLATRRILGDPAYRERAGKSGSGRGKMTERERRRSSRRRPPGMRRAGGRRLST